MEVTLRQRQTAGVETAVEDLGRAQARMVQAKTKAAPGGVEISFHPKQAAGGDFFSHFELTPDQYFCLMTDVSGHDLQAAYLSAYVQGIARGMVERAAPMAEILGYFNRFLLDEWNPAEGVCLNGSGNTASVAVCSVLFDFKIGTAKVLTCGTPAPVHVASDGRAQVVGRGGGFPLGWFPDLGAESASCDIAWGGAFLLWTDGLEDLAEKLGLSPLSLGFALRSAQAAQQRLPALDQAADDLLFVEIPLRSEPPHSQKFHPLVIERYHGGQVSQIDDLEASWQRSLRLALPELPEAVLHDVLLASREAVLNSLKHGCGGRPERRAKIQISCQAGQQRLRVWVEDEGPGHHFNVPAHEQALAGGALNAHLGLILIQHLAQSVNFERQGASVTMDFQTANEL